MPRVNVAVAALGRAEGPKCPDIGSTPSPRWGDAAPGAHRHRGQQPQLKEAQQMTTMATTAFAPDEVEQATGKWWVLLLTGIAWVLVSILVLDGDYDSALTIGYLTAGYLVMAGVMEFVLLGVVEGWKWLHVTLGVMFVLGGIAALTTPFHTFRLLASLVGFFLVLKGTVDFVMALATRHDNDLWWLLLISG